MSVNLAIDCVHYEPGHLYSLNSKNHNMGMCIISVLNPKLGECSSKRTDSELDEFLKNIKSVEVKR